jgi:hypothetical protein
VMIVSHSPMYWLCGELLLYTACCGGGVARAQEGVGAGVRAGVAAAETGAVEFCAAGLAAANSLRPAEFGVGVGSGGSGRAWARCAVHEE